MSLLSAVELDKRPFKGKGVDEWLARSEREYRKVVLEMESLSAMSRKQSSSAWYVYLHHRKVTGQQFLMWRSFGVKHIHLTWDRIEPAVRRMKQDQCGWYEEMNDQVRLLNAKEVATRKAMRLAQELVKEEVLVAPTGSADRMVAQQEVRGDCSAITFQTRGMRR